MGWAETDVARQCQELQHQLTNALAALEKRKIQAEMLQSEMDCLKYDNGSLEEQLGSARAEIASLKSLNQDMAVEIENHRMLHRVSWHWMGAILGLPLCRESYIGLLANVYSASIASFAFLHRVWMATSCSCARQRPPCKPSWSRRPPNRVDVEGRKMRLSSRQQQLQRAKTRHPRKALGKWEVLQPPLILLLEPIRYVDGGLSVHKRHENECVTLPPGLKYLKQRSPRMFRHT